LSRKGFQFVTQMLEGVDGQAKAFGQTARHFSGARAQVMAGIGQGDFYFAFVALAAAAAQQASLFQPFQQWGESARVQLQTFAQLADG
jgi:hypothetical protein